MKLSEAAKLYLNFKAKELARRTLKEYESDINLFIKTVGDKEVSSLKTADIILFRSSLSCSPSLINRRLSAINGLLNFLVDMELLQKNPFKSSLRIKRASQKVPEALTKEEVSKILKAARERGERDYLLVKIPLFCGLRISELLSLKREDIVIYKDRWLLRVLGKGGKERFVPLQEELAQEILSYSKDKEDGERLFPLTYQGARYVYQKVREKSGVDFHPHKLRHTFATFLVERGVDIRVIQALLGHSSPTITTRYAKVRDELLFKAVESLSD